MRVPVKDGAHAIAVDRFFEAARSEIGEDLRRLAFHRRANRCVVEQRDALLRAQACERRLELQRFVNRFLDERLDGLLAPRAERAAAEAAGETL